MYNKYIKTAPCGKPAGSHDLVIVCLCEGRVLFVSTKSMILIAAAVKVLSASVLVLLFLMQKFGTSRVSFLFSPIMGAWTFATPIVGIYSIIHYYPTIFKALSPHYIIYFFLRGGKTTWLLLGGTVLCITGEFHF